MKSRFRYHALKLCLLMIVIFGIQYFSSGFTELFVLNEDAWTQPWRFLTSVFLHGGLLHLLYNIFALALFGSILESMVGEKKFLLAFFVTGILANLISINFYSSSLGASGAIFGVLGALVIVRPLMVVWAFGLPMPMFVAGILWAVGDIIGAVGFLIGNPMNNTGNIAHLSGMFFGFIFGMVYRRYFRQVRNVNVSIDEGEVRNWERSWMK